MVDSNGNRVDSQRHRVALGWLRAESITLIGVMPVTGMILEACGCWDLNAEWVALYGLIVTAALSALGLAKWISK